MITYKHYSTKYNTKLNRLNNPKIRDLELFEFPTNSILHTNTVDELGISTNNPLLNNVIGKLKIYHELDLEVRNGTARKIKNFKLVNAYFKANKKAIRVRKIDLTISEDKNLLVVDYSLAQYLLQYRIRPLVKYDKWLNLREGMLDNVNLSLNNNHFIIVNIPKHLESKGKLNKYSKDKSINSRIKYTDSSNMDLICMWEMLDTKEGNLIARLPDEVVDKITILFIDDGKYVSVKLSDLVMWGKEDPSTTKTKLLSFYNKMIDARTPDIGTTEEVGEDEDVKNVDKSVQREIDKYFSAGKLSDPERKRLEKMSTRWTKIDNPRGKGTLETIINTPVDENLTDVSVCKESVTLHDKSMLNSSITTFDKEYLDKLMFKDIVSSVVGIQKGGIIIKDLKVRNVRTVAGNVDHYSVNVQPIGGVSSTLPIKIPVIDDEGNMLINNVKYNMNKQRGEMPIAKTNANTTGLTSYYGKVFVKRSSMAVNNKERVYSRYIIKLTDSGLMTDIKHENYIQSNEILPRDYTAMYMNVSGFRLKEYVFIFNQEEVKKYVSKYEVKIPSDSVAIGYTSGGLLVMDKLNVISVMNKGNVLSTVGTMLSVLSGNSTVVVPEYATVNVYNKKIPVIIALGYLHGLDNALKLLKVKTKEVDINVKVDTKNVFVIEFTDVKLILHIETTLQDIIVRGLSGILSYLLTVNSDVMNHKGIYTSIMTELKATIYTLKEIELMNDMFIDPITEEILNDINEPVEFDKLLIRASELLTNDNVPESPSIRYKGYERISGMVYYEMVNSVRDYRNQINRGGNTVNMKPDAVWRLVTKDETKAPVEESNPIRLLKEKEIITFSGHGGRSAVSMVKSTRGFNKSELGVISESTPDAAKVGIRVYTSGNPKLKSLRGVPSTWQKEDGVTSLLSTSALLSPSITHDDGKRVNHISGQQEHGVATPNYKPSPLRTGYEQLIANRSGKLMASMSKGGVVTSITEDTLIIEKDGIKEYFELGTIHGNVNGSIIPHKLETDLKIGDKVNDKAVVVYNSGFFSRNMINKDIVDYKGAKVCKIAILDSADTIEDGSTIHTSLSKEFITPYTTKVNVLVNFNSIIHNLVKIGDELSPSSILCTIEDPISDGLSVDDTNIANELNALASINPTSDVYGKISDIKIMYYGELEDMSESLKLIVSESDERMKQRVKRLSLDEPITGRLNEPLNMGATKLMKGNLSIDVYIDGYINMGVGDKLVFGNGLKSTVSRVCTTPIVTKSGVNIEGFCGYLTIANRNVTSPIIMGLANRLIKEANIKMLRNYRND